MSIYRAEIFKNSSLKEEIPGNEDFERGPVEEIHAGNHLRDL
jgi:hypothetical protein